MCVSIVVIVSGIPMPCRRLHRMQSLLSSVGCFVVVVIIIVVVVFVVVVVVWHCVCLDVV